MDRYILFTCGMFPALQLVWSHRPYFNTVDKNTKEWAEACNSHVGCHPCGLHSTVYDVQYQTTWSEVYSCGSTKRRLASSFECLVRPFKWLCWNSKHVVWTIQCQFGKSRRRRHGDDFRHGAGTGERVYLVSTSCLLDLITASRRKSDFIGHAGNLQHWPDRTCSRSKEWWRCNVQC